MTERPDDHGDHGDQGDHGAKDPLDDELAAALRAEVPASGPGYWDGIDAMLARVAHEAAEADEAGGAAGPSGSAEGDMDTTTTVIRLTAMNETDTTDTTDTGTTDTDTRATRTTTARPESTAARRFGSTSLLARAAVLTLLLGAIGAIAWVGANNGDGPGETVNGVAGPGTDPASDSDPAAEASGDAAEDPAAPTEATAEPAVDDVDPAHDDPTAVEPDVRPEWVWRFLPEQLVDADIEAIGCWFRVDQDVDSDVVFHGGFEGGYMVLQGELVVLTPLPDATEIEWWTVSDYADLSNGEPRWAVSLTDVGEPVETTIESSDRTATLTVTAADGTTWSTRGVLGCGV